MLQQWQQQREEGEAAAPPPLPTAVKVVTQSVGSGEHYDLSREPLLSTQLAHPNIVPTYKTCVVRVLSGAAGELGEPASPGSGGSSGAPGHSASTAHTVRTSKDVRPSLTDRNTLVELMPANAVLEPG